MFKKIVKFFGVLAGILVIAAGIFAAVVSDKYVVPVMMYHSVNYVDHPKSGTTHPDVFRQHMEYLQDNKYNVISFDEYVKGIAGEASVPRNSVVITFDDGYLDNYTIAYKILQEYKFPAIMFIPTADIGKDGFMTWQQVKEMAENNVLIGSHTRQQVYLPDAPYELQIDEVVESRKILEQYLKKDVHYFAYPIGGFNESIKKIVQDAGYLAAATTNRGYDKLNKDLYELNRIRFGTKDNANSTLFMKLSGYYNLFRKPKNPE